MKFRFHKLTPRDDVEIGIYSDAFDYVFEQDHLRNIAVTGPFGAGKSSVLESYKKQRRDLTFIHISLARFDEPASSTVDEEPKENGNGNNNDNSNGNDNDGVKGNDKNPIQSKVASVSDSDLWSTMLDERVAKYLDENVLHYYFNYSESLDEPFDSSLIKFMEACSEFSCR